MLLVESQRSEQAWSILNQLQEDLKIIFLTGTKCKICFKYVRFNCKRKNRVIKWTGKKVPFEGGGGGPTLYGKFLFLLEPFPLTKMMTSK